MEYSIRPYRLGEERYVAEAHRRVYAQEYRWGESFISYAMRVALEFANREKTENEALWVAEAAGTLIGSIMLCKTEEPKTGQLRLYLVEKAYRGYGVGAALLRALMQKAVEAGYQKLILWTASPLTDAIRQYKKLGFSPVEEVAN
ncbi:MAG: GNAT family N-acetyltransferase, partial [Eubacteriales bacterium]|nr:GNAT family N-acetyltransferase [Eubacteriales bacterium]